MTKTEKFIVRFVCIILIAALISGFGWLVFTLDEQAQLREEFDAVCAYEHGEVEGDVCIRDGEVILYKKTLDLEHQD